MLPTFRAISSGNFETPLFDAGDDEIAHLLFGLELSAQPLGFDIDRERAARTCENAPLAVLRCPACGARRRTT